jgi:hypothetical protein
MLIGTSLGILGAALLRCGYPDEYMVGCARLQFNLTKYILYEIPDVITGVLPACIPVPELHG